MQLGLGYASVSWTVFEGMLSPAAIECMDSYGFAKSSMCSSSEHIRTIRRHHTFFNQPTTHTHTHQAAIQQFVKSETRVAQKRAFASLDDVAPGDPMLAFC